MKNIKAISFLLAVLMALSSFTISAFALEIEDASEDGTTEETATAAVTWEDVIAGMATPEEYCEANGVSDLSTALGGEASTASTYSLKAGTYYLNNWNTGKYLRYASSSGAYGSSGLIANLKTSIQWTISTVSGGYKISPVDDSTSYLAVSESGSVEIVSGSFTGRCLWSFDNSDVGGLIVQNVYTGQYLYSSGTKLYVKASLGTSGTSTYLSCVWRTISTSNLSTSSSTTTYHELESSATFNDVKVDVDSTVSPRIKSSRSNVAWKNAYDFTYTCSSGTSRCVSIASLTGKVTGKKIGYAVYTATHKVTGQKYTMYVYVDTYMYKLVNIFAFDEETAILIRDLYDKMDDYASDKSKEYRAWLCARFLGGLYYNQDESISSLGIVWNEIAGLFAYNANISEYFYVNELGYTSNEFDQLRNCVISQHNSALSHGVPDFAHLQIALATRLAYNLDVTGLVTGNLDEIQAEDLSYIGGWLGDAVIKEDGKTTSMKDDDYCADLDAENIYQLIITGKESVAAFNLYYNSLSSSNTRATIFLTYISYSTVLSKVLKCQKVSSLSALKDPYPDTYNFLLNLYNKQMNMEDYT
ncbi:MAG: hypothetical protein LUH43_03630 [Clostridia bacterium]|nr:hypothetical protein [Clostridia bacterium]